MLYYLTHIRVVLSKQLLLFLDYVKVSLSIIMELKWNILNEEVWVYH